MSESWGVVSQIQAALDAGLDAVSAGESVRFKLYQRIQLSVDGYVFYINTGRTTCVTGALHYATERRQELDETIAANHVILDAESGVDEFNEVEPGYLWVGDWPIGESGPPLQVAFSMRDNFFRQAKIWHYSGYCVFPVFTNLFVESNLDLPQWPIVSNSLPVWMQLNTFGDGMGNTMTVPVWPSFAVPENARPPYIVAHIEPGATKALQAAPTIQFPSPLPTLAEGAVLHEMWFDQLCRDEVELVMYGFQAQMAARYYAALIEGSKAGLFGFCSPMNAIQDEKRPQTEIAAIAMKKSLHVSANYSQSMSNVLAERLILAATVTVTARN